MKKTFIISLITNIVFVFGFSVYAAISYDASQITYKTTTLDHAIDDLYSANNAFSTITFNANGGSLNNSTIKITKREKLPGLPVTSSTIL